MAHVEINVYRRGACVSVGAEVALRVYLGEYTEVIYFIASIAPSETLALYILYISRQVGRECSPTMEPALSTNPHQVDSLKPQPAADNPFANTTSNANSNTANHVAGANTTTNTNTNTSASNTPVRGARSKDFKPRTPRSNGLAPASPNPCIVLKNLDYKISQGELEEVVRRVAGGRKEFVNLSLIDDRATRQFRGMAFVNFHNVDDASNALNALGKMSINNRKVVAEYRRLRPGEKVFLPSSSPPPSADKKHAIGNGNNHSNNNSNMRGFGRTTFERDVKTNGLDEHGNIVDKRKAFFNVRNDLKKADFSREKLEKQQRDLEREKQFRKKLLEFHGDADVTDDIEFENDLTSYERRMVHLICDEIGLGHMSVMGDDGIRVLKVTKHPDRIKEWAELTVDIRKAANERKDEEKKRRKEERDAAKLAALNLNNININTTTNNNNNQGANANGNGNGNGTTPKKNRAEREGIKWFKPRSAKMADGEEVNDTNSIKVPQVQIYVPPRQPLGPDGTIGFQSRIRKQNDTATDEDNDEEGRGGEEEERKEKKSAKKKKNSSGFKSAQTPLNPSVQPFTPSAAFAT